MPKYTLEASDGNSYTLDSPNELTQVQLEEAFSEAISKNQQNQQKQAQLQPQTQPQQPQPQGNILTNNAITRAAQKTVSDIGQIAGDAGWGAQNLFYRLGDFGLGTAANVAQALDLPEKEAIASNAMRINQWLSQRQKDRDLEKQRRLQQGNTAGTAFGYNIGETIGELAPQLALFPLGAASLGREALQNAAITAATAPVEATTPSDWLEKKARQAGIAAAASPIFRVGGTLVEAGASKLLGRKLPTSAEEELVKQGKRFNIPITTSDVKPPETFMGKSAQTLTQRVPFVGTGGKLASQQKARTAAIEDTIKEYLPEDAFDPSIMKGIVEDVNKYKNDVITKYNKLKNEVLDKPEYNNEYISTPNVDKAIDNLLKPSLLEVAKKGKNTVSETGQTKDEITKAAQDKVQALLDIKNKLSENNGLGFLEETRKIIGNNVKNKVPGYLDIANSLYRPLREDIGLYLQSKNLSDLSKWKGATKALKENIDESYNTSIKKILDKGDVIPETVKQTIFSKNVSELRLLKRGLSPEGLKNTKSLVVQDIYDKSKGVPNPDGSFSPSPEKFLNEYNKRKAQFNEFFTPKENKTFEGLTRVLNATREAGRASVMTSTGMQTYPFLAGTLLTDILGSGGAAIATTAGIGAAGRVYQSKMVRNLLVNLSKVKKNSPEEALLVKKILTMQGSKAAATELTKEDQ